MSSFDLKRVRALFQYDWMLEKRRIGLSVLIVLGLYIVLGWFIWSLNTNTWLDGDSQIGYHLPAIMLRGYCSTFFSLLTLCSVFFVTPVLQRKFAKPQTATAYLTLPGTTAEKYWVMLAEYALGFVACAVLYVICFYGTAVIGNLLDRPDVLVTSWEGAKPLNAYGWFDYAPFYSETVAEGLDEIWQSIFRNKPQDEERMAVMTLLKTTICMTPFVALLELGYYLVLNMLFRAYGQIKSILCYLGTQMGFNIIITFAGIALFAYCKDLSEEAISQLVVSVIHTITYLLWFIPVLMAGMYYLLYRLMARKQAK